MQAPFLPSTLPAALAVFCPSCSYRLAVEPPLPDQFLQICKSGQTDLANWIRQALEVCHFMCRCSGPLGPPWPGEFEEASCKSGHQTVIVVALCLVQKVCRPNCNCHSRCKSLRTLPAHLLPVAACHPMMKWSLVSRYNPMVENCWHASNLSPIASVLNNTQMVHAPQQLTCHLPAQNRRTTKPLTSRTHKPPKSCIVVMFTLLSPAASCCSSACSSLSNIAGCN